MGKPTEDAEPLTIKLKPGASMERVKARPRQVSPEKVEQLESRMRRLRAADMALFYGDTIFSSVTMAVPKRRGFRTITQNHTANAQVQLVPWPMPDLEVMSSGFRRVPYSVVPWGMLERYWKMPLAEEAQYFLRIGIPSEL